MWLEIADGVELKMSRSASVAGKINDAGDDDDEESAESRGSADMPTEIRLMPRNHLLSGLFVVFGRGRRIRVHTSLVGNEPLLGLDLQGGVSVVLDQTGWADGQDE